MTNSSAAPIVPVILCGGSGTRLWPLSRKSYPKQFTALSGGDTLFRNTLRRAAAVTSAAPVAMTHDDYRFIAADQMAGFGGRVVVEPASRNTGPAICTAALLAYRTDPNALTLVLPSDHAIRKEEAFADAIRRATPVAAEGAIVTFGITPDRPATGYGYIECEDVCDGDPAPFARFVEKPEAAAAAAMISTGRYLWNAGMFLFAARTVVDAFREHAPDILAHCQRAISGAQEDLDFLRIEADAYCQNPDISFDHAIMEKVDGVVLPVDLGWNDLGAWDTIWREADRNADGVATTGGAMALGCHNSLLRAEDDGQRLVGIGLENIVAVATKDAVLVADMSKAQNVKDAVRALKVINASQAEESPRSHRPWGWYESLSKGDRFQVKRIMVKPGGRLSLQSHMHRSEHWVVVSGTATVTVGDMVKRMTENESVYIPCGDIHRLENNGKIDLHLIEVQSGPYLGEDDIVRYEDIYARAAA